LFHIVYPQVTHHHIPSNLDCKKEQFEFSLQNFEGDLCFLSQTELEVEDLEITDQAYLQEYLGLNAWRLQKY